MYYRNYLIHYGVKGMKWGVRRYQNADGSLTSKGKKRYSDVKKSVKSTAKKAGKTTAKALYSNEYKIYKGHKKAKQKRYDNSTYAEAKKLSNQELQQRINRINLEQSYISAVARDNRAAKEASQTALTKNAKKLTRDLLTMETQIGKNIVINTVNKKVPVIIKKSKK